MAREARIGDTVTVHYTGTLDDGTVFDSSRDREPLEFTLGEGQIIPGFEKATLGLHEGESTKVHILADEAYGPHHGELVAVVTKDEFPAGIALRPGLRLQLHPADGNPMIVTVVTVTDDDVTLDANHPLAGKDLNFDIELVKIEEAA